VAICEVVGGPRDGEKFTVPGSLPPDQIKILDTSGGPLVMWHPAAVGAYPDVAVIVCELDDAIYPRTTAVSPWRYLWPKRGATVAPQ
jgi:hypothetical protein